MEMAIVAFEDIVDEAMHVHTSAGDGLHRTSNKPVVVAKASEERTKVQSVISTRRFKYEGPNLFL